MKATFGIIALCFALLFCKNIPAENVAAAGTSSKYSDEQIMETCGWLTAHKKKLAGIEISAAELKVFLKGFSSALNNEVSPQNLQKIYFDVDRLAKERREKVVQEIRGKNRNEAAAFFANLQKNTNVFSLPAGDFFEVLKPGDGHPKIGQTINVHFTARLINGQEFDQMGPVDMVLVTNRNVCRGWTEAVQKLGKGGALKLYVPPPLSEKDAAAFGVEPDSAMIFEIELLDFKDTSPQDLADALTPLPPEPETPPSVFSDKQIIETWGWIVGQEIHPAQLGLNQSETATLTKGLAEGIQNQPAPQNLQEISPLVEKFVADRRKKIGDAARKKHLAENAAFFMKLKQSTNATELPDGLFYEILKPGTGPYPKPEQRVNVLYTGRLTDGSVFDSTALGPLDIDLDKVIRGWSEGVQKINQGGKIKLYIPPALAYGSEATSGIPADSILIFEVELLEIKDHPAENKKTDGQ